MVCVTALMVYFNQFDSLSSPLFKAMRNLHLQGELTARIQPLDLFIKVWLRNSDYF